MEEIQEVEEVKTPLYDPSKAYSWGAADTFHLSGAELEYMYKSNTEFLNLPASVAVLRAIESHRILERMIAKGVESGTITETPPADVQPGS